ncbi:hypothetical protein GCM10011515_23500 [Tsuneonella deserti]|uniref:Sulfotransferase domain protein n=1 Tax=Tsuneonella deserti TaxID=2035528 RepID=A0ABQ1SCK8_9SPHN|nr:sulfotransferase [Tsuneonella deserti]GGE03172.1 hypothetical protein GCM10011515_23500 [Tsuneonella deserti]
MSGAVWTPVVILGAGRSGTNILRDCLVGLPGFATWDCDEINPVWRVGQARRSDDEFSPADLTPTARRVIGHAFARIATRDPGTRFVVEKTCANSLRPGFVDEALDGARFIQIVRDGRDVVPSAMKRWRGELEVDGRSYFIAKARNTPLRELPYYLWQFAVRRLGMLLGRSERLSRWGPLYRGLEDDANVPLSLICARQWAKSVERTNDYLATLPAERWYCLAYEDFVADPAGELRKVVQFLGAKVSDDQLASAVGTVRTKKGGSGKGLDLLDAAEREPALATMQPQLERYRYLRNAV